MGNRGTHEEQSMDFPLEFYSSTDMRFSNALIVYHLLREDVLAHHHTANEGPLVRIQYKCPVPIYVFLEMKLLFPKQNYNVLSPSSYTHKSVRDSNIFRIRLPILL